ncbi:MAG: hypothetical protein OXJ62_14165 [Spirochaetaceae bacterium]|nr:hypothetical protein [Spirochaetaceae bacterium]
MPRDLRQPIRCGCGALLRVALVEARRPVPLTPDYDEPAPTPPWWNR